MIRVSSRLRFVFLAVAGLVVAITASAHDLAIDELTLRPNLAEGRLRGQLTFDPALTRGRAEELPRAEIEARLLKFVAANVGVEADGKKLELRRSLREIYVPAGAAPGDIVMLDAELPRATSELRVEVGRGFRALAVSIDLSGALPNAERSVLVLGGAFSPPYRFGNAPLHELWKAGPPSQFAVGAPAHDAPQIRSDGGVPATPKVEESGFARRSTSEVVVSYLVLGVTHILPSGLDHVLFVVALVLGTGFQWRRLLLLLSLFTLAHTVTLALGALGWVVVHASIIEPLIALSIAFVAIENLLFGRERRYRPYVVVVFGLLHGQGFAGALKETGVPEGTFVPALLSFNVGVELGQLVVAAATATILWLFAKRPDAEAKAVRWGSAAIALVGLGWTTSRLFS